METRILLKPAEAAQRLAISRASLYQLLARGELRSVTIGSSRRVPVAVLEDYIAARLGAGQSTPWPRQSRPHRTASPARSASSGSARSIP
jgi:excisionase family DNA binding protein